MTVDPRSVDVHQHFLPGAFVDLLRKRSSPPRIVGAELELAEGCFPYDPAENDLELRLAVLDHQGTDLGVLSLQQTFGLQLLPPEERGELEAVWDEGIVGVVGAADGRFLALAAGSARPGFVGACVGSDDLGDLDALEAVIDSVRHYGGFVFVHPSGGRVPPPNLPGWWGALAVYTAQMQAAYLRWLAHGQERWPDVPIVFSILAGGGPFQLERLASRGIDVRSVLHSNVYFDTASYGRRALELCVEAFGVEQIVYGSDLPVVDPAPTLRAVKGFGESVEKLIMRDNPNRFLT